MAAAAAAAHFRSLVEGLAVLVEPVAVEMVLVALLPDQVAPSTQAAAAVVLAIVLLTLAVAAALELLRCVMRQRMTLQHQLRVAPRSARPVGIKFIPLLAPARLSGNANLSIEKQNGSFC
jgi:hypothetical protein